MAGILQGILDSVFGREQSQDQTSKVSSSNSSSTSSAQRSTTEQGQVSAGSNQTESTTQQLDDETLNALRGVLQGLAGTTQDGSVISDQTQDAVTNALDIAGGSQQRIQDNLAAIQSTFLAQAENAAQQAQTNFARQAGTNLSTNVQQLRDRSVADTASQLAGSLAQQSIAGEQAVGSITQNAARLGADVDVAGAQGASASLANLASALKGGQTTTTTDSTLREEQQTVVNQQQMLAQLVEELSKGTQLTTGTTSQSGNVGDLFSLLASAAN